MDESLDTFPRLLLHHASVRPRHPATREKDLGIWQTWTWAQVADEVRALACGLAALGFERGDAPRDHRRQPAAPVLVDGRGAVPRRRAGADVPGRAGRRVRLRAERRRDRLRDRRGPGAGRQAARGAGRRCRRSRTSTTTIRAACATTTGVDELRASCRRSAASSTARIPGFFDARGRARASPTTCRSCSTRRAPPASRRACARRTRRSSPPRGAAPSSTS